MQRLALPQLTGARGGAQRLLTHWELPDNLAGVRIHLDAGATLAGTDLFTDDLVREILVERGADELTITLVGPILGGQFRAAADHYGVSDRLHLYSGPGD